MLSFEARIVRQQGKYQEAIAKLRMAIDRYFDNKDHRHPGLARCYAHLGLAQLLEAQNLQLKVDKSQAYLIEDLLDQALDSLKEAEAIAQEWKYARVLDRVHYFRARIYLEKGQPEKARAEVEEAREVAEHARDWVILAHALVTLSMTVRYPLFAHQLANEAMEVAEKTDSRRVEARVRIRLARTVLADPIIDVPAARELLKEAQQRMRPSDGDYLREELEDLEAQVQAMKGFDDLIEVRISNIIRDQGKSKLDSVLKGVREQIIQRVYDRFGQNQKRTADFLGIGRNTVRDAVRADEPESSA